MRIPSQLMSPVASVRRLVDNATAFAPMMNGALQAAAYIYRSRGQPDHRCVLKHDGLYFEARRRDWPAVREVLIDGEYSFLEPFLVGKKKPVILDVGAHVGAFAIWTLANQPGAVVHSLEASTATFEILRSNCRRNNQYRWLAYHYAAWGMDGPVSFDNQCSSEGSQVRNGGDEIVDGVTLSTFLAGAGLDHIDVAKIDIEGAEESFLVDQGDALQHVDALVVEIHPECCNQQSVISTLRRKFTHLNAVRDRLRRPLILATRRAPPEDLSLLGVPV